MSNINIVHSFLPFFFSAVTGMLFYLGLVRKMFSLTCVTQGIPSIDDFSTVAITQRLSTPKILYAVCINGTVNKLSYRTKRGRGGGEEGIQHGTF